MADIMAALMRPLALYLLVGCSAPLASLPRDNPTTLTAGIAVEDITPPPTWRRAGGYREEIGNGVHDPLYAKAMVLEQAGVRAALLVLDLCSIGKEVSDPLRREASLRTGIPVSHIVVSATHTHGGPEYYGVLWDIWRDSTIARHGRDIHQHGDYVQRLIDRGAEAVARAFRSRRAVRAEHVIASAPGIAFNRRYLMKDGTTVMNPGKKNPDIVRVMGPVDEELPFLLLRDVGTGQPVASYTSFAMHVAAYGGPKFGADFPAVMQDELRRAWGAEFVSIFAEGAAGDCNHIDVASAEPQPADSEPARLGVALARAVMEAAPRLRPVTAPALAIASAVAVVPMREVTTEEATRARQVLALQWVAKPAFLVLVEAYRALWTDRLRKRDRALLKEEVQAFRIGADAAIVTLPHEIFVELGLQIRRRSPFATTIVVSLANDVDFYVPTRKAFAEGSYEISTSPYLPGGGERLVETAVGLLTALGRPNH